MVDGFYHTPILLVSDFEGGRVVLKELFNWQVAWNFTAAFTDTHISDRELLFARGPFDGTIVLVCIYGCVIFTAAKDIINRDKN